MNEQWIKTFRNALKSKVGKGWNVIDSRGYIRLQMGKKPNITSVTSHYKWSEDHWLDALNRIVLVHKELINFLSVFLFIEIYSFLNTLF